MPIRSRVTYDLFIRGNYIFALVLIIVFLPFSKYILSIGEFWLVSAWIMERINTARFHRFFSRPFPAWKVIQTIPFLCSLGLVSIAEGIRRVYRNKAALAMMSLYLLHLLGLFFTTDWDYAFKDLRIKAPMVILPLVLATSPGFGRKEFYRFLLLLILTILAATLSNSWYLFGRHYVDIREVSRHISHIIFGLLVSLSVFSIGYLVSRRSLYPGWFRFLLAGVGAWFLIYLILTKSFTGLAVFIFTLVLLLSLKISRSRNHWMRYGFGILLISVVTGVGWYVVSSIHQFYHVNPIDLTKLDTITSRGNRYINNTKSRQTENGNYLWIYIQWDELREAWNKRSKIPFDSLDMKHQPIRNTLVRFLTSKGFRKDADGVNALSEKEVHAIERGIADKVYMEPFGIRGRIYEIMMGYETYRTTGNPSGFSLMQRLEYWKASVGIIRNNWLTGVGTGDMNQAFSEQYDRMHTKLAPGYRWRSHDQYLSILVGFGVAGFAWFLFSLLFPVFRARWYTDFFVITFLAIGLLSMLTEDTIESQAGVTFFYFYYSFFLFARKEQDLFLENRSLT